MVAAKLDLRYSEDADTGGEVRVRSIVNEMNQPGIRSTRRNAVIVTVIAMIAVAATVVYLQQRLPRRWAIVDPGILYRSGQPKTWQLDHAVEDYDIKTLLIVRTGTSKSVPDEMEHAQERGMRVIHIPVESRQPIPDEQVRMFFEIVDDPANQPVLIHCSAGRHRTGYLCALYRIERMNWTVDRAMEELLSFGFDTKDQSVVLDQLKAYRPGKWKRPADDAATAEIHSASHPS